MNRSRLGRRAILRGATAFGASISVGLPQLSLMLNSNGNAYADGTALPTRFGIWFFGNGIRADEWVPPDEGGSWTPSTELQPLVDAGLKPDINVLTGFEPKMPFKEHHMGMCAITTGGRMNVIGPVRDTVATTVNYPSIDVVAANQLGQTTPFRSLELGVCSFTGTDEGTTFQHLSMNGPNDPNPSEYSAEAVFARLFAQAPNDPAFAAIAQARRSVLDVVSSQITSLQASVGAADRQRLEGHFESIRSIEKRLQQGGGSCATPAAPTDPMSSRSSDPIAEKNKLMSDLLAVALACDLTRVFTVNFETCGSQTLFWQTQASKGMHGMCHDGLHDQVHAAVVFTMEQAAYCLSQLKGVVEGEGTLLDNCSILLTSELSNGNTHGVADFPILTAGKGGGKLKTGLHYRSATQENTSKALLTVLRGAGLPLTEFGHDEGHVTEGVGAIEV